MVSFMHDHTEQVTLVPSIGTKDSTFSREDLVSFLISSYFHRYPWGNQSSIVPTQMNALTATKKLHSAALFLLSLPQLQEIQFQGPSSSVGITI